MFKKHLLTILLSGCYSLLCAQTSTSSPYFSMLRPIFNEHNSFKTVAFVEQRWRLAGNTGFNESIRHVENILKQAGYVEEKENEFEAPLTYRIEKRALKNNTWEPVDAHVRIIGESGTLLEFKTNRNMIPINCASTPAGGIDAEVVYVGKGSPAELADKDLSGKIVFGETNTAMLYAQCIKKGAIGVLGYSMPSYTQPEKYVNSIQFSSLTDSATDAGGWGLLLSYAAKERLKTTLDKGPVKLHVEIKTKLYPSEELTVVANVRGTVAPDQRFVFSAHVQEPGANDNATGVGTLAEMARVTAELVKSGKLTPQRSITFLWGDEIVSTGRYVSEDKKRAQGIMWGLSLDMVGENTKKTGGTFLIEKMPDPSAIWTRGSDKHTEWGAGSVKEKDLFPHYYNDFLFNRCKEQGRFANWEVNYNPFEGGSDHTPFLQAGIPGLLMWHFTDVFYHTDADRLDKVSPTTMKNVGVTALTTAYSLVTANESTATSIIDEVRNAALERLKTEFELSKKAIAAGGNKEQEQQILQAWEKWYTGALESTSTIPVKTETTRVGSSIKFAINAVHDQSQQYLNELK